MSLLTPLDSKYIGHLLAIESLPFIFSSDILNNTSKVLYKKVKAQSVPKEGLVCIETQLAVIPPVSVITQAGNTEMEVLSARAGVPLQITKPLARVLPVFTTQAALLLLVT